VRQERAHTTLDRGECVDGLLRHEVLPAPEPVPRHMSVARCVGPGPPLHGRRPTPIVQSSSAFHSILLGFLPGLVNVYAIEHLK